MPDTAQWKRIRRSWEDHGYIALAVRKEGRTAWIIPFPTLDLDFKVMRSGVSLPLESATVPPYGYSSSDQDDHGMIFKPRRSPRLKRRADEKETLACSLNPRIDHKNGLHLPSPRGCGRRRSRRLGLG